MSGSSSLMHGFNLEQMMNDFKQLCYNFWRNPGVYEELNAYAASDNDHEYTILKGLIPKSLIGQITTGVGPAWKKSDTFFTDFALHNPPERILSATDKSLIICNNACHDVRLYSADVDPTFTDKTLCAGMSYLHLLVIPTSKVYNAVSLKSFECIDEMIAHFNTFWFTSGSVDKAIDAIRGNMERRYSELLRGYEEADPTTAPQRISKLDNVMSDCRNSAAEFATKLRNGGGEFFFGFHVHPHASVGHLHMHVLLKDAEFRKDSTNAHDRKTVSAEVVRVVLEEESKLDLQRIFRTLQ